MKLTCPRMPIISIVTISIVTMNLIELLYYLCNSLQLKISGLDQCWVIFIFLWKWLVIVFGASSQNHLGFFKIKFPILRTAPILNFKKIRLDGFQAQQVSQDFEPLIFKGGSHKLIIINQGFFSFFFLICFWFLFSFLYFPFIFFWVCFFFLFLKWKMEIMKQTPIFFQ